MGFVCQGRYVLEPVSADDSEKYIDLYLDCLAETYNPLFGEGFEASMRASRGEKIAELRETLAVPGARAFLAYEVPGWTPEGGLSCAVGASIDWTAPVGLALSAPGPAEWETHMPTKPLPEGMLELNQLYTLSRTHGTGLGSALLQAVLPEKEPAYLWYIAGNEKAISFYEKQGFEVEGPTYPCGGDWVVPSLPSNKQPRTGRMLRK